MKTLALDKFIHNGGVPGVSREDFNILRQAVPFVFSEDRATIDVQLRLVADHIARNTLPDLPFPTLFLTEDEAERSGDFVLDRGEGVYGIRCTVDGARLGDELEVVVDDQAGIAVRHNAFGSLRLRELPSPLALNREYGVASTQGVEMPRTHFFAFRAELCLGALAMLALPQDIVEQESVDPTATNRKRRIMRRPTLVARTIVHVRPGAERKIITSEAKTGPHEPSRPLHSVRGHLRHLKSGRVVPVRSHRRGDERFGVRIPEYHVRGPKKDD